MELNRELEGEEKRLYDEFVGCVKKYRKSCTLYPIAAMFIAGIFYNPQGTAGVTLVKKMVFAYVTWLATSFGVSIKGSLSCSNEYKTFVESLMNKKKMNEKENVTPGSYQKTSSFTDTAPTTSDLSLPINLSDDTIGITPNLFDEFKPAEGNKPVKKSVTYDELWASHIQKQKSWEGDEKWYGKNSADTPTSQKRATNIYGDPLD